jgi:arabinofuranan 3-O-arabinosyltransferase
MIVRSIFIASLALLVAGYFAIEFYVIGREREVFSMHPLEMRDFANYWIAARAYFDGRIGVIFEQATFIELLRAEFGADYPWHNWSYPPHYLFFCLPLGLVGYFPALYGFLFVTLLFFLVALRIYVRRAVPRSAGAIWRHWLLGLLLVPIIVTDIRFAQNGFLISGLFLLALAWWRDRPVLAGVALGLLTIKPQLGLLIPLLLLADRNWIAIASAVVTTLALIAASSLAFGFQSWIDYVTVTMPYQSRVLTEFGGGDLYLAMMLSAYSGARTLGLSGLAPWLVHFAFALPALLLFAVALASRRIVAHDHRMAVLVVATFIVCPYAFNYDAGVLAAVCAVLAIRLRGEMRGEMPPMQPHADPAPRGLTELRYRLLSLVAALPILANVMAILVAPVAPLVLLVVLGLLTPQAETAWLRAFPRRPARSAILSPAS